MIAIVICIVEAISRVASSKFDSKKIVTTPGEFRTKNILVEEGTYLGGLYRRVHPF